MNIRPQPQPAAARASQTPEARGVPPQFQPRPLSRAERATQGAIADSNVPTNDYVYRSGWSGTIMGQQYRFNDGEAQALVRAIETRGIYRTPAPTLGIIDMRVEMLRIIHQQSESRFSPSISLSAGAAAVLNRYAARLGTPLHFRFDQPAPIHPIG